jgi:Protein of unknown function (DUF3224)
MATTKARGVFTVKSWDEGPWAEVDAAPKLTHARVVNSYAGDIAGEGTSESLMFYPDEATATYAGYERVVGSVGGRSGSFVLSCSGGFEQGATTVAWSVVAGSGTGELQGLRGDGGYVAGAGAAEVAYSLDYHFE